MADNLLYEQSTESQMSTEPFVSRQVVYVIDQNNGNYAGQIQLDTSSLSNSGKYCAYSEAYLQIPLVVNVEATAAGFAADAARPYQFLVGLKNGFYQLIHSLSVEYNNTSVVQLTPYTNFYVNYKLLTTFSELDVKKNGQSLGFYPDSATSWDYSDAAAAAADASSSGPGVSNNRAFGWERIYPSNAGRIFTDTATRTAENPITNNAGQFVVVSAATAVGEPLQGIYTTNLPAQTRTIQTAGNYGFYKRCQWCAFDPTQNPYNKFTAAYVVGPPASVNETYTRAIYKNFFTETAATLANTHDKTWYILARIRLKDVCDFFDKLPLVKGAYIRMIVNTNTSQFTLTTTDKVAAAGQPLSTTLTIASQPTITGGTNPLMFASAEIGQGANLGIDAAGANRTLPATNYQVRCGIAKVTSGVTGTVFTHPLSSCRLYVPLYQMNPDMENNYISLNRTKRIVYRDIYQYSVDVGATSTFNSLLTNGIPNPKTVIIIPILQAGANNVNLTGTPINVAPHLSPFSAEPGTTSPLIALTNFNVQIAGVNMFIQNEDYDFEQWVNELSSQNAINGNLVDGLTSGLVGELEWQNNYRYYVCDVSRRIPAEDSVPKSVQILGRNVANVAITLFVFIEFERSIEIDLVSGAKLF